MTSTVNNTSNVENIKSFRDKDDQVKLLIGTWMGGYCLSHLQIIGPEDATDEDVRNVVSETMRAYHAGITRGVLTTYDDTNKLLDALTGYGYSRQELVDMIDNARGRDTEYIGALSKLLEHKRARLLADIDYNRKGCDKQADEIIHTYRIDGYSEMPQPAYGAIDHLIQQCMEMKDKPVIPACTPVLTRELGGLKPGQLITVAARPAVGKTAITLQMAEEAARAGKKVLHIPLEMTAEEMMARLIYRHTNGQINKDKMDRLWDMDDNDWRLLDTIRDNIARLTDTNLIFIPGCRELSHIKRNLEIYRPDLLVIDQLTLLRDTPAAVDPSPRLQYKHMVETLKVMAQDFEIPIILAAQVNRTGANRQGRPTMQDLKESGSIEESSDIVLILHREDDEPDTDDLSWLEHPNAAKMTLSTDKVRGGRAGRIFTLMYDYESQIFFDTIKDRYGVA
jgi:replicative DNA helicase